LHPPETERANEYRSRAAEITRHAASQFDALLQVELLSIAAAYLRMAEHIERESDPPPPMNS